jgi:hypothetical protein
VGRVGVVSLVSFDIVRGVCCVRFVWVYGELLGIKDFRSAVIDCDVLGDVLDLCL